MDAVQGGDQPTRERTDETPTGPGGRNGEIVPTGSEPTGSPDPQSPLASVGGPGTTGASDSLTLTTLVPDRSYPTTTANPGGNNRYPPSSLSPTLPRNKRTIGDRSPNDSPDTLRPLKRQNTQPSPGTRRLIENGSAIGSLSRTRNLARVPPPLSHQLQQRWRGEGKGQQEDEQEEDQEEEEEAEEAEEAEEEEEKGGQDPQLADNAEKKKVRLSYCWLLVRL